MPHAVDSNVRQDPSLWRILHSTRSPLLLSRPFPPRVLLDGDRLGGFVPAMKWLSILQESSQEDLGK
jgi:hypothetical protein